MEGSAEMSIDDQAVLLRLQEKKESRIRDFKRFANREISAEDLQRENSIFTREWIESVQIPDYFKNVGVS